MTMREAAALDITRGRHHMSSPSRIRLLDCPIDRMTMPEAVSYCLEAVAGERRTRIVLTVNAAIVVKLGQDEPLRAAVEAGDLVLADGMPLVWLSRWTGADAGLEDRVAGVDLMAELLREADRKGLRLYFLGAKPKVVATLVERVARDHPGAVIAGYRDGYFGPEQHEEVADTIAAARPDLLFVGMPTPFKEIRCEAYRHRFGASVVLPVGGAFDVLAGFVKRAPRWMQRAGLEWSWRLMMEPRKMWWRYLSTNTIFLYLALREIIGRHGRRNGRPSSAAPVKPLSWH
jgi:N-acetylglucosaminyldiphosphoundecaprenol N-acetyl-beta-D-mannosaminyltransferase